jgi:hypothetical protein
MKRLVLVLMVIGLLVGCGSLGGKAPIIDTAIQYRSTFNTLVASFSAEISTLPAEQQKVWAQQSLPFIQSGSLALDAMDVMVGTGGSPTPETVQQYIAAKNKLIDLLAKVILEKKQKGVK